MDNISLIERHAELHFLSRGSFSSDLILEHNIVKEELDLRNVMHVDRNDYLDIGTIPTEQYESCLTLDGIYSSLPNNIVLQDYSYVVYQRSTISHNNMIDKDQEIVLVTNGLPNSSLVEATKRIEPLWLSNKIRIEFSKKISKEDVPLYKFGLFKVPKNEYVNNSSTLEPVSVKPLVKFRLLKQLSGKNKGEFYSFNDFYNKWGSANLSRGIIVSKLYNAEDHAIHKKGDKVAIIHEGYKRDNVDTYPNITEEILAIPGDFILHANMVAYDVAGKDIKSAILKEACDSLSKKLYTKAEEDCLVFHVCDMLYYNGSLVGIPYRDRLKRLRDIIPDSARYLSVAVSSPEVTMPSDLVKHSKELCTQHGLFYRTADSKYPVSYSENRSHNLVKLYQPSDIELNLRDCPFCSDSRICCLHNLSTLDINSYNNQCSLATLYKCPYLKSEVYE